MTVKLTFECTNVDEAKAILDKLVVVEPATIEISEAVAEEPAKAPAKKKAAKKKAAKKSTKKETAEPANGATEITEDDVRAILAKLVEEKGIKTAREVLGGYNAKSIGELPKEKYSNFMQACESYL